MMHTGGTNYDEHFGKCAFCKKNIPDTTAFFTLNCERHIGCMHHEKLACPLAECNGGGGGGNSNMNAAMSNHVQQQQQQQQYLSAPVQMQVDIDYQKRKLAMEKRYREPLSPPKPGAISKIGKGILWGISRMAEANKPDYESSDPFVLLKSHVPLTDIVNKHGMDITELINDHGVTINDFFENGYTLPEMCDAFASRLNHREGFNVLYNLGISADHFFMCPELVQPVVLNQRVGYTGEWLKGLGYTFKPGVYTIPQMLSVGMSMPFLLECGLNEKQDWENLKATCQSPQQLSDFGYSQQLENQLIDSRIRIQQQQQQQQFQMPYQSMQEQQYSQPYVAGSNQLVAVPMSSQNNLLQQQQQQMNGFANFVPRPAPVFSQMGQQQPQPMNTVDSTPVNYISYYPQNAPEVARIAMENPPKKYTGTRLKPKPQGSQFQVVLVKK